MRCSFVMLALIVLLPILTLCFPYCQVVSDTLNKFYLTPGQISSLDISRYFRGYNLMFQVESKDNNYQLIPPVTIVEEYPIQNITEQEINIELDVLSDNQYQYKQQGVLLSKTSRGFLIRFGDLNQNNGINFKNKIEYKHDEPINCFDILMLDYDTALIDCQKINDPENTDVILIVKNGIVTVGTKKKDNINTEKRKLLSYRTQNSTFVLSILLSDFIQDHTLRNQSYINTYIYNHTFNTIEFLLVINWETLGGDELTISDLDIDPFGYIYLADNSQSQDYLIVRFKINDNATVDSLLAFDLNQKPARLSTVFVNGIFLVEVATEESIIEIDWTNEPKLLSSYQLPQDIGDIIDVQMNQHVIMVSSTTGYYFYSIKQYKERQLLHHFVMNHSVVLLDKVNPYGVFVSQKMSYTYLLSSGSLILSQPKNNITQYSITPAIQSNKNSSLLLFKATSTHGKEQKSCQIKFQIQITKSRYSIYIKKQPPILFTLQNPANYTIHLQSYYLGSLLNFKPRVVSNVKYTIQTINPIQYQTQFISYQYSLGTSSLDQKTIIKGIKIKDAIILEICTFSHKTQKLTCAFLRNITEKGDILDNFFMKIEEKVVLVYSSSLQQGTIRFINVNTGEQQFSPLILHSNLVPITHLTLSQQIIIITFSNFSSLFLYKYADDSIKYFMEIDLESFPDELKQEIFIFEPQQVKIGQTRLIYILNNNLIIIMRLTSIDATYISHIQIPALENMTTQIDYKIYQNVVTIVLRDLSLILQYNVQNPYHPILTQTHNLQNHQIDQLQIQNYIHNSFLYITSKFQNSTYIHIYKADVPAVSAHYYKKVIQNDQKLMSGIVYNTLIIFGTNNNGQGLGLRVYSRPTLGIVTQSIKDIFKTIRPYGFTIISQLQESLFLGSLRVVNYQTIIKSTEDKKHHIFLPLKTSQTLVSLPKQIFTGPISRYDIQCSQCQNKIQLQSYTYQISRIDSPDPTHQYLYFSNQLDIIWILKSNTIQVVDENLEQLSPPIEICSNCTCTNFQKIDYQFVVAFCIRPNSHKFFVVLKSLNNIDIQVNNVFQLPNSLVIQTCYLMKSVRNRLFILDNNIEATGKGEIRVFKIGIVLDDIVRIQLETTLDYSNFQIQQQTNINGFDIISLNNYLDGKYFALVVTLGDKGIGYLCYDSDYQNFNIVGEGDSFDLNRDSSISSYVLDNNQYQQIRFIQYLDDDDDDDDDEEEEGGKRYQKDQEFQTLIVVSSTSGCHFHLSLSFLLSSNFQLTALTLINTFNKYGSQKVLNWMVVVGLGMCLPFHLGIAHYNQSTHIYSITLYPIQKQSLPKSQSINFISSIQISYDQESPLSLVALITPLNQQSMIVYNPSSQSTILYNITTQNMYLLLNYDNIDPSISSITLIASNDYSFATSLIEVSHDHIVPISNRWYIYFVTGLSMLVFLIGLIYGITRYYLKRKQPNKSLFQSKQKKQIKTSLLQSKGLEDDYDKYSSPHRGSINDEEDEI